MKLRRIGCSLDASPPQIRLYVRVGLEVVAWWIAVLVVLFTMFGAEPFRK